MIGRRMRRGRISMSIKGIMGKWTKKGHLIRMMIMIPIDRGAQMNEDDYQKKEEYILPCVIILSRPGNDGMSLR